MKTVLLLFFAIAYSFSQENKVAQIEYTSILNLGQPSIFETVLFVNNNESYFLWNQTLKKSEYSIEENLGDNSSDLKINFVKEEYTDSIGSINYKNISQNKLISRNFIDKDLYYIEEELPQIQWLIKNDIKTIDSFNCQKATAIFRGRNYTAWFTMEVPISNGPWKLQGLPGLIVEVSDDTKEVSFFLKSFKYSNEIVMPNFEMSNNTSISLIEFEIKVQNYFNNFFSESDVQEKFQSKLPRNVVIKVKSVRKLNRMEILDSDH